MRPVVAAVAAALGLLGLVAGVLAGPREVAHSLSDDTYEVWVTDNGFNPSSCLVRRGDNVRWVNKSSVVRNVKFDNLAIPPDLNNTWSTGDLQPAATSGTLSFDFAGSNSYHEVYSPSFTGAVATTDRGVPSCDQAPPTPTPTNTPTPSPTPTPTPPRPEACAGQAGCAVVPVVARDDD
jgi:plastocyanin